MSRRQWGNLIYLIGILMLLFGVWLCFAWPGVGRGNDVAMFDGLFHKGMGGVLISLGGLSIVVGTMLRLGKKSTLCPHCGADNSIQALICHRCGKQIGQE